MQEVKQPNKKPFIFYYLIALVAIMLINSLLVPQIVQRAVKEVDYNTFMQMTYDKQIDEVQVQDNQIVFTAKDDKTIYKTGLIFLHVILAACSLSPCSIHSTMQSKISLLLL